MAVKINVNQDVTSRLRFEPRKDLGMFCVGKLDSIEFDTKHIAEDKEWEFKGLDVPRLAFHFVNHADPDGIERYFTHSELPIAATKKDGVASTDKSLTTMLTALWARIKHIHDAYKSSPNYRPWTYEPVFSTAEEATPAKRIEEFTAFFNAVNLAFVGDESKGEKPIWIGSDGSSIPMTMKLIATDGKTAQYLDFPKFIDEGCIQPYQLLDGKLKTTLRFRPTETAIIQAVATPVAAGSGAPGAEDVPEEIRNMIRQ